MHELPVHGRPLRHSWPAHRHGRAAERCGWDMLEPGEPTSRFVESRGKLRGLGLRNVIVIPRRRVWTDGAVNISGATVAQGWGV